MGGKVKVIKKNELKNSQTPEVTREIQKQEERREIVSTVSDWVNEFQRRKETKPTFNRFFAQN